MKRRFYNSRAQSIMEYIMTIVFVAAALIGMRIYVKRAIQGRLKEAVDDIADQYSARHTTGTVTEQIRTGAPTTITGTPEFVQDSTGRWYEVMKIERHEDIIETTRNNRVIIDRISNEPLFE